MSRTTALAAALLVLALPPRGVLAQAPPRFQEAVQKFSRQDFTGAIEILEGVTRERPDFPNAWMLLGRSHLGAGEPEPAVRALRRAAGFPGLEGQARYFEGLAHAEAGDLDEAFRALQQAKASGSVNMTNVGVAPQAAVLREDPRYRELFPSPDEYADPISEDARVLQDWTGEAAGDQFGWIARNVGDVDGDGVADAGTSAPSWSGGRGKIYVYSSRTGELVWSDEGDAGDQLGLGIEAAGDANADGVPDVAAGAPGGGKVHVYDGRTGAVIHTFTGPAGEGFGRDIVDAGDLDGDGHDDLLVGWGGADQSTGTARVYSGSDGSILWEQHGERQGDSFGASVGGWSHGPSHLLVIGAPNAGEGQRGRTYVYRGLDTSPAFVVDPNETGSQNGGMFVSVLGDVDGDGTPDVYSSDWADAEKGGSTGRIYVHSGATGERILTRGGEAAGDGFGIGVADAGDVDGDGHADLVVGAWQHASLAPSGGKVYVISGATGEDMYTFTGKVPGETFGFDATGLGDVDGDGVIDFLLTSAWSGINDSRSGRMLIVAGKRR